jgi:hypothetical protein
MTADVTMPKSEPLADHAAGDVSHGDQAASNTTTTHPAASPEGATEGAPTPFYDHLMSMVQATALENGDELQDDPLDLAPPVTHHGWRMPYLMPFAAGLIVAVAAGGALIASKVGRTEPPVVAADSAPEAAPQLVGSATTAAEPAEKPFPAPGPDGQGPIGVEENKTAEGGTGAAPVLAANPDEPPGAVPVSGEPGENLGPGVETGGVGPADTQVATKAMGPDPIDPAADPVAEQPAPADAPWSLEVEPATETGPTADRATAAAATHIARVVSHVNMRAGPSNGQAVLAQIPKGSPVEVIVCRSWCEVTFAGQRGWVYKTFIDPSPIPGSQP